MTSREELPRFVEPMLARSSSPPHGDCWALEVKFDGMRLQLRRDGRAVCARSRPGRDCTEEFPELAGIAAALGRHRVLLDGELVCLGIDGKPDFARLRRRLRAPGQTARLHAERTPATFLAFDLLHLDGRSTRGLPYHRRRELLDQLTLEGRAWATPRHFVGDTDRLIAATSELGLEGVVAKRLDSPYLPGLRSGAWLKHKHRRTESFLVSGWLPAERRRPDESLLLLCHAANGTLEPAGSVPLALPNGQSEAARGDLERLVLPPARPRQRIRRLAPELVATVAFHGPPRGPVRDPILRAIKPVDHHAKTWSALPSP